MIVGADGRLPLPWLARPLAAALAKQRGHALLLHASPGIGALPFALVLAQAWLCESRAAPSPHDAPCGRCGSCHLFQSHLHPDLRVLLPEALRRELNWPLAEDKPENADNKRKPSRQIRIDDTRTLVDWVYKTSARGRGKVVVLHPAEAMNPHAANALLKTLEEPPPGTRLVLSTADPALLLPTVRSRCQHLRLPAPPAAEAAAWLVGQGIRDPELLLAACSGRPLDAQALASAGIDAAAWCALPAAVAEGRSAVFGAWPVPLVLDALHKLCHDAMARASGAAARFFPDASLPPRGPLPPLLAWQRELARVAGHDEHPWQEGLLLDALVSAGARALGATEQRAREPGFDTLLR